MIVLLSPSKTMEMPDNRLLPTSLPPFRKETEYLVSLLRSMNPQKLAGLMEISPKLAELNAARYAQWEWPGTVDSAAQAVLAFKGDVYEGLDAGSLTDAELVFAQQHLRILSGLYGILRPLDLILPYRLEMGLKWQVGKTKDLYDYWDNKIHDAIRNDLTRYPDPTLVNLASQEYYKAIRPSSLKTKIITPSFLERKGSNYKMVSFFAKKARGLMARFIIRHGITQPSYIKGFEMDGYVYNAAMSNEDQWVFTRG
ncbi:MAG: peroxide stress protein YaaA [Lentimicrobiaceae bacterium]|nr:peroxide stress protein YaaA [Lentimicrobiaceae bacterium]